MQGHSATQALAGQRTALNLAGTARQELSRGMVLAPSSTFESTSLIDVSLSLLPSARPVKHRAKVHFHSYTMECIAEVILPSQKIVAPGSDAFAQLKLAKPTLLLPGDRFIIRQFSPVLTIGGGTVLDNAPTQGKNSVERLETLQLLKTGSAALSLRVRVSSAGTQGMTIADAVARTGWRPNQITSLGVKNSRNCSNRRIADQHRFIGHSPS